jgi:hypothetical protein
MSVTRPPTAFSPKKSITGAKEPRQTHLAMSGKRFKLSEGLYDSAVGRTVKPAELINCHCTFRLDLTSIVGEG